ncbi:MAG: SLC13 family permease [Nitrospirota bacterium]|jgi:di/tricarboxylate transporter
MSPEIALVLALCVASVVLFATEWLPYDLVALLLLLVLGLSGVLTPSEALAGFANPAVVTVGAMFILAAGVLRTGALAFVERRIADVAGSYTALLLLTMMLVGAASAFVNSTPVVVVFLPVLLGIANERKLLPSRLLMPISYAAILGGTCTLIGTSTNILISELVAELGAPPIGIFELTPAGLIFAAIGLVYVLVAGPRLLPRVETVTSTLGLDQKRHYISEIRVGADSDLVGKPLRKTIAERFPRLQILDIVRGGVSLWTVPPPVLLQVGDCLVVRGDLNTLLEVHQDERVELLPGLPRRSLKFNLREMMLAELVLTPNSQFLGQTLAEAQFQRRFQLYVMGIMRHGRHIQRNVIHQPLMLGDILLVFGDFAALSAVQGSRDFLRMDGVHEAYVNTAKAPITLAVILGVVVCLTFRLLPLPLVAISAAVALVVTNCISLADAYRAIQGRILVLIIGTLALGLAMEKTGAGHYLARQLVDLLGPLGPVAVISGLYFLTSFLTEVMSNNASAVLLVPIAIGTAETMGIASRPFIMAVLFGASASFATPIGYKTNTLVYAPGGYRYRDFIRMGVPLKLLLWAVGTWLIPRLWPLTPE